MSRGVKHIAVDYAGRRFGSLLGLGTESAPRVFDFLCDCGQSLNLPVRRLHTLHARSMCARCSRNENPPPRQRGSDAARWTGGVFVPGRFYSIARMSAEARGIEWGCSIADLDRQWTAQKGMCAYSGAPLEFTRGKLRGNASLDRRDSLAPYSPSNVHFVTKTVNMVKRDLPEKEFLQLCRAVAAHFEES